jgi:hypothetical protein
VRSDDIEQGEVLWIQPELHLIPGMPNGFAVRVVEFLGWADSPHAAPTGEAGRHSGEHRQVWVRGAVLDQRGIPVLILNLCVPVDQARAVPVGRRPYPDPVPGGAGGARHRVDDDRGLVGPPPGYRRRPPVGGTD